jgi:SAM-dependent methyltransferase
MADIDCQIEYWNRVGLTKPFSHHVAFDRLSTLVPNDAVLLDYGCGYGRVLESLRDHGYQNLLGAEPADGLATVARSRLPTIPILDLTRPPHLELPHSSVDAVLLFSVLTCIPTDEGQQAVVAELHRVMKPGGLLYISDFWLQNDARTSERYAQGRAKYGTYGVFDLPEGVTLRHHDPDWIDHLTRAFDRVALDDLIVLSMNGHPAKAFQWFGRKSRC